MCGIAGFSGDFEPALLERMSASIAHRGPDDHGSLHLPLERLQHLKTELLLQCLADVAGQSRIVLDVQQDQARLLQQLHRPPDDDDRAENADDGIERAPAEGGAEAESRQREQRRRRIRQDMDIGRAQIVIVMAGFVLMLVTAVIVQHHGACDVHAETQACDDHRFQILDRHGRIKPAHRFDGDAQTDDAEDQSARKPREIAELSGAEREAAIRGMPSRLCCLSSANAIAVWLSTCRATAVRRG